MALAPHCMAMKRTSYDYIIVKDIGRDDDAMVVIDIASVLLYNRSTQSKGFST